MKIRRVWDAGFDFLKRGRSGFLEDVVRKQICNFHRFVLSKDGFAVDRGCRYEALEKAAVFEQEKGQLALVSKRFRVKSGPCLLRPQYSHHFSPRTQLFSPSSSGNRNRKSAKLEIVFRWVYRPGLIFSSFGPAICIRRITGRPFYFSRSAIDLDTLAKSNLHVPAASKRKLGGR